MPEYIFTALDETGKEIKGSLIADTPESASESLKRRNLYVVDLREKGVLQKEIAPSFRKKIALKDLSIFCRQMATMLMSGIPLVTALEVVAEQFKGKNLGKDIEDISQKVKGGTVLSAALEEKKGRFPAILINTIAAGEMSGSLDEAFDRMATHFEKEMKLRQKIVNALIYPVLVILIGLAVAVLMLLIVIPTFVKIFKELNVDLPAPTRLLIGVSEFLTSNLIIIVLVVLALIFAYYFAKASEKGGYYIDRFKLKIPLVGNVILGQIVVRFARTLGTMLSAGVSLVIALETTRNVLTNKYIEKEFEKIIEMVESGQGLSDPISQVPVFPRLLEIMIRTGEESGNVELMLTKAADYFENEVENQVTRLTTIFEPLMIVLLAVMIGFLMVSIYLPMFKMYGSIGVQ